MTSTIALIERYQPVIDLDIGSFQMETDDDGRFVKYADHLASLEAIKAERDEMSQAASDLCGDVGDFGQRLADAQAELTTLLERCEKAEARVAELEDFELLANRLQDALEKAEAENRELAFLLHEGGTWEEQLSKAEARVAELEAEIESMHEDV